MTLAVRTGSATNVGLHRDNNEDAFVVTDPVFLVADGMGGHAAGEVASALAVETMARLTGRSDVTVDLVRAQVLRAGVRIHEETVRRPATRGMGTTLTGLVRVVSDGAPTWVVVNIGDSRTYAVRDGRLEPLTTDHSEVQAYVDGGVLSRDEARTHPLSHVLTRCLGLEPASSPDVVTIPAAEGQRFLLCSDGLTGDVSEEAMAAILAAHADRQEAADALVAAALAAGGHDNVTAVVLDT